MKIVDLESIANPIHVHVAGKWVAESFVPVKTDKGLENQPGEAIYFFSTSKTRKAYDIAKAVGLDHPKIPRTNYWNGNTIVEMLGKMVTGINEERRKYSMPMVKKFPTTAPTRVWVLTLREFETIEKLGAIPLPFEIVRGHANV